MFSFYGWKNDMKDNLHLLSRSKEMLPYRLFSIVEERRTYH